MLLSGVNVAAAQQPSGHTFHVFVRGAEAGTEEVTVQDSGDGWTLRGSGRLGNPLNLTKDSGMNNVTPAFSPDGERIAFAASPRNDAVSPPHP